MLNWFPLHVHSHYSLRDAISQADSIAQRCVELGLPGCAITDRGNVAGVVPFMKSLNGACKCGHQKAVHPTGPCDVTGCSCTAFSKYNAKPIIGCEFNVSPKDASLKTTENSKHSEIVLLCKDKDGWKKLIRAVSAANSQEHIYKNKPRLSLDRLSQYSDGKLIVLTGHAGSELADSMFMDPTAAYFSNTYEQARVLVKPEWKEALTNLITRYADLFGKENLFLEVHTLNSEAMPAMAIVGKTMRYFGKLLGIKCVAATDSRYCRPEDAQDHHILLCSKLQATLQTYETKLTDPLMATFFKGHNFAIPSTEDMLKVHEPAELENTLFIAEQCTQYDLLGKPMIPVFPCPDGFTPDSLLKELCVRGWKNKIAGKPESEHGRYRDRIKKELSVLQTAGLASYFLIVRDYVADARNRGDLVVCRGSGAGCLVSYLIGISDLIDPMKFDLSFERFYNAGRNTADRVSLPDIDCDFPVETRERVFEGLRRKYGKDKVSQMVTYTRLQGRGIMREVLRIRLGNSISMEEIKKITKPIPDESRISDKLQEMREDTGHASIIQWALENVPKELEEWCRLEDNGELNGQYAGLFKQAIRLEGTKKNPSKHAAGIVISSEPLEDICPMIYDPTSGLTLAGMEMGPLEDMGISKFDVLGINTLSKIKTTQKLLETGEIEDDD